MSDNADECVRLDTRLAGQVCRYHTWPITGRQTIAEHCWQIMRIYLSVVDQIDPHMVHHIMFHDIGEHFTGDLPYPIKAHDKDLKDRLDHLELKSQALQLQYWDAFRQTFLSKEDKILFKQIELVEMAEFGLDQVCFGNHHGMIIADRCLRAVFEGSPCPRLCTYVKKRIALFMRQIGPGLSEELDNQWWFEENWEKLHGSERQASGGNPL